MVESGDEALHNKMVNRNEKRFKQDYGENKIPQTLKYLKNLIGRKIVQIWTQNALKCFLFSAFTHELV